MFYYVLGILLDWESLFFGEFYILLEEINVNKI